ncbi:Ger(x)C family spore germination protein [Bacillus toyonensis]|uniref:Spore gernimation protein n=1 Tax=Bacillus toyonensis TaxID=155322 RepID=A0A2B5Y3L0_9BACI|nr:Ger(x)C family spore germination protein [Bacillus toyonensis]PGB02619.1 spore gernimation protein [Bacillus toyonensis]PHD66740.1 spore gernimation protein [Bacillus toyonensis]
MKIKIVIIIMVVVIFWYGRQPKQVLDDLEMPVVAGYDYVDKDKIKTTISIPIYAPDKSVKNKTLSSEDELSKITASELNQKTSRPTVNGKLEVVVYSEKVAKNGIGNLIDTLKRDSTISEKLFLTVTDGQVKKLLNTQYGLEDTGIYLSRLLEQNMAKGLLPNTNLHYFLSAYYSHIKDPFLPLIRRDGKEVKFKGIALFKDDRYVKTLRQDHFFVFKALIDNVSLGAYKVKLNDHDYVTVQSIYTKHKYEVQHEKEVPNINIFVKVTGNVQEFTGEKLNKKQMVQVKKQLKEQLEKQADKMIHSFQKFKIDPLGLGDEVRSQTRNFNYRAWLKQYPHVKVNVKVNVMIVEKGVSDGE